MIDDEKKDYFNKQLDNFIRGIQEDLHLSYKETIWMIIDGIFNSAWFQKEFYILKNETWNIKTVWIENLKIVQKRSILIFDFDIRCLKKKKIGWIDGWITSEGSYA